MTSSLDIVIPVYNEADNILIALDLLAKKVKRPFRVIVVYDFDGDTTVPPVRAYIKSKKNKLKVILHKNSIGRGALNAIKSGLAFAEAEYIVVTMADLSDPPEVINQMMEKAQSEGADVVCSSRYMKGGSQKGGPLLKRTLSFLAGTSLYYLTSLPTHDVTNSFKLYRRSFLKTLTIESTGGFELGMEIVIKAWRGGFNVTEVPTQWKDRAAGKSNFKLWKWLPSYLRWYFFALFGGGKKVK
jgi:glycosyltransferase involved in cell wall biosynthesis